MCLVFVHIAVVYHSHGPQGNARQASDYTPSLSGITSLSFSDNLIVYFWSLLSFPISNPSIIFPEAKILLT